MGMIDDINALCSTYVETELEILKHLIEMGVQQGQARWCCLRIRKRNCVQCV
uniref:Uncharacterized protein n=1 Tax=Arion vulgaris TaxID=1028688 RepID=A0A0B6ZP51_9EUPU